MRIPGHRLIGRGAPHTAQACQVWPCDTLAGVERVNRRGKKGGRGIGGHGHGLCQCGATSPHELTGAERRRWHRRHRQEIRAAAPAA